MAEKVTLKSSDKQEFQVDEDVAFQSITVKNMLEDTGADFAVPLPNVNGATLSKVLEYCSKHSEHQKLVDNAPDEHAKRALEKTMTQWDKDFIDVDQNVLYFVTLAANYLNIKDLLGLCCQTVADIIKGKTPDEIRAYFNIKNDFTPEEEEEVRRENQWAFE
ncbi:hypothetical protein ABBQ32_006689 [Trebouxia sp. C0010 RCD-2024]